MQITDTTMTKTGKIGVSVLHYWKNKCTDKNKKGKISIFIKTTKTKSPTNRSGASS